MLLHQRQGLGVPLPAALVSTSPCSPPAGNVAQLWVSHSPDSFQHPSVILWKFLSPVSEIIPEVSTALGVVIIYSYLFPQERGSGNHHRCQQLLPLMSAGCNRLFLLISANNNNAIQNLPAPFLLLPGRQGRVPVQL